MVVAKRPRLVFPRLPKKLYALYREGEAKATFLGAFTTRAVAKQMKVDLSHKDASRPRRRILLLEYER